MGLLNRTATGTELSGLSPFAGCSRHELRVAAALGTRLEIPAGRRLVVAGRRGREVFVVLAGRAACHVGGRRVAVFGAGAIFGEVAALDGGARTATVVALEDMEVNVLDVSEFDRLLREVPPVAACLAQQMAARIRSANELVGV